MIEILPQTTGNMLAIKATKKLTTSDYENVFIPKLNELIEKHGKIRVAIYLADGFEGWEPGAMWDDAKFGIKHRNDFEKVAIFGSPKYMEWFVNIGSHFMDGQLKTFANTELDNGLAWIRE